MKLLKSVEKQLKKLMGKNALMILAGLVVVYMLSHYSSNKGMTLDSMTSLGSSSGAQPKSNESQESEQATGVPLAAQPLGENSDYASAQGTTTSTQGLAPGCSKQPVTAPSELLPKGGSNQFSQLNPMGQGDLSNVNLLKAGHHTGINTVGSSLRNANLQLRSDPPNPQVNVGPWNQTTIEPDTMRVPLELHCGSS